MDIEKGWKAANMLWRSCHQGRTIHSCHQGSTQQPPLTSASSPRANSLSSRLLTRRWRRLQTCSHVKWRLVVPPRGAVNVLHLTMSRPDFAVMNVSRHHCDGILLYISGFVYRPIVKWHHGEPLVGHQYRPRYKARANSKLSSDKKVPHPYHRLLVESDWCSQGFW